MNNVFKITARNSIIPHVSESTPEFTSSRHKNAINKIVEGRLSAKARDFIIFLSNIIISFSLLGGHKLIPIEIEQLSYWGILPK